jgi:6,7-dimethyl-8-ribityllumazine synthase
MMARSGPSGWFSQSERRHARSSSHGVVMRGTIRHRRHNVVGGHVVTSLSAFALETTVTVTVTVTVTGPVTA